MVEEKACQLHRFRLEDLERRMSRVEKFILSVLIMFATSSAFTVHLLINLPDRIIQNEHRDEHRPDK